ncbi:hypothetical protein ACL02S_22780 [Nocardia sp. 004]|uniref:hypothetical protein n=1 Tax=Nocardia sp. 004 TaxID=3385978 RepID=UPI0039A1DCA5
MTPNATIRTLLAQHTDLLARNQLTDFARAITDPATPDRSNYDLTHRVSDLHEHVSARAAYLMGANPDIIEGIARTRDIVDADCRIIGTIDLVDPDVDALIYLADNLTLAATDQPVSPPPPNPRVRMYAPPTPDWAQNYPSWLPWTDHQPTLIDPATVDGGRAALLCALTDTPTPNAALICLRAAGASPAETLHSGFRFCHRSGRWENEIRVAGTLEGRLEIRRYDYASGRGGVLHRFDNIPANQLRHHIADILNIYIDPTATAAADQTGIDSTPPHPAILAAHQPHAAVSVDTSVPGEELTAATPSTPLGNPVADLGPTS